MGQLGTLLKWRETHENIALDLIRIYLGIALFIRGCLFMADQSMLINMVQQEGINWLLPLMGIHYVTLAHLYGGLMMTFGLLTRTAVLIQVPILIGAVFVFHFEEGLFALGQSLELSVLVLFLLLVILVYGPGKYSFDYFFFVREAKPTDAEDELTRLRREQEHLERTRLIEQERALVTQDRLQMKAEAIEVKVAALEDQLPIMDRPHVAQVPTVASTESTTKLKTAAKYGGVFTFGFVLLLSMILLDSVPIAFTFEEIAGVGGVVILVFGLFFLIYRSAFSASE